MSKECDLCGFKEPLPFTCKFCGGSFCYTHRLPEYHNCPGLAAYRQKVRDAGKIYHDSDIPIRKPRSPFLNSLAGAFSVIKSSYSLAILVIAIISFFLQYIVGGYYTYLALSPIDIFAQPWKYILNLVTHMFLHGGPVHLLFNMMFLFFFGPELERRIGGKMFLVVYFLSGFVAAIGYSLWTLLIVRTPFASAVGASGALFGIFACLAVIAPNIRVYIYLVPMKITHALIFFALLDLLFIGAGDLVARSAHLSGVAAGLFIGRSIKKRGKYRD